MKQNNKSILMSIAAGIVILSIILYITYVVEEPTTTELTGDITIGTLLPITGDLSSQGEGDIVTINLAVDDFNEYLDKNNALWELKVVHEDSVTNPETALEKLAALHAKNIDLIVGPTSSGELQNMMEYINSNNILVFSQSSTAPSLAIPGDTVFRLTPDDTKQGPAIAALLDDSGIDVIIQLVRADTWGEGLSKTIEESFLEDEDNISHIIKYDSESPEVSVTVSLLSEMVSELVAVHGEDKVGVVIIGFAEVLEFMQSASQHEILDDIRWFGTDGTTNDEKIINDKIGLEFAEKVHFTTTLMAVSHTDLREEIEERVISQFGKTPKSYAYSAYDIVWILGLSIEEANSNDVDKITPIISDIAANYNGVIGDTSLNEAGDLDSSDYAIWQISDESWNVIGHYNSATNSIVELHILHTMTHFEIIENEIKIAVENTKSEYDGNLDSITNLVFGEYYSFVVSGDFEEILVHPNKDKIGKHPTAVNNADISVSEIIETLKTEDGIWINYVFLNPATGNEENKRTWLSLHEGYIFGSGYYLP